MSRLANNIVGLVGLVACVAIGLLNSIGNSWVLGPRLAISIPRLDATWAAHIAAAFVREAGNVPTAAMVSAEYESALRLSVDGFGRQPACTAASAWTCGYHESRAPHDPYRDRR